MLADNMVGSAVIFFLTRNSSIPHGVIIEGRLHASAFRHRLLGSDSPTPPLEVVEDITEALAPTLQSAPITTTFQYANNTVDSLVIPDFITTIFGKQGLEVTWPPLGLSESRDPSYA